MRKLLAICLLLASCKEKVIVHQEGEHDCEQTYTATFEDGSEMPDLHREEVWHNISTGIWVYNDYLFEQ